MHSSSAKQGEFAPRRPAVCLRWISRQDKGRSPADGLALTWGWLRDLLTSLGLRMGKDSRRLTPIPVRVAPVPRRNPRGGRPPRRLSFSLHRPSGGSYSMLALLLGLLLFETSFAASAPNSPQPVSPSTVLESTGVRLAPTLVPKPFPPGVCSPITGCPPAPCASCQSGLCPPQQGMAPPMPGMSGMPGMPGCGGQQLPCPAGQRLPMRPGMNGVGSGLFARFTTPRGIDILMFNGQGQPNVSATPTLVRLNPYSRYMFALTNVTGGRQSRYVGTIDVVTVSGPPPGAPAAKIAVPIDFSDTDILALQRDRMITKYLVLENPDEALPIDSSGDAVIRYDVLPGEEALEVARTYGYMVLVVRVGNRLYSDEELAGMVPMGSVHTPPQLRLAENNRQGQQYSNLQQVSFKKGKNAIACGNGMVTGLEYPEEEAPACNDCLCPVNIPGNAWVFDLRKRFDLICDGGDIDSRVRLLPNGQLVNVDPSDTVAEYGTECGPRVAVSNRVCIYAPRFIEIRLIQTLEGIIVEEGPNFVRLDRTLSVIVQNLKDTIARRREIPYQYRDYIAPQEVVGRRWPDSFIEVTVLEGFIEILEPTVLQQWIGPQVLVGQISPVVLERIQKAVELTRVQFPKVMVMEQGASELVQVWQPEALIQTDIKCPLLQLCKMASTGAAGVGDEVTFTIQYRNGGSRPMTNVAVVDSLVGRLEYITGSAKSSRGAIFTAQPNEVGSAVLRWELEEPLAPGEWGQVEFKAKLR